jgi:hypothetical protein
VAGLHRSPPPVQFVADSPLGKDLAEDYTHGRVTNPKARLSKAGTDGDLFKSPELHGVSPLGPFTTWTISVADNSNLDLSRCNVIALEFHGYRQSFPIRRGPSWTSLSLGDNTKARSVAIWNDAPSGAWVYCLDSEGVVRGLASIDPIKWERVDWAPVNAGKAGWLSLTRVPRYELYCGPDGVAWFGSTSHPGVVMKSLACEVAVHNIDGMGVFIDEVYGVSDKGQVWWIGPGQLHYQPGKALQWSAPAWQPIEGGVELRSVAVAVDPVDLCRELFAIDKEGKLHRNSRPNGGDWSGWSSLGGRLRPGCVAAAFNLDRRIEVFALGESGEPRHIFERSPRGKWSGWASLGGPPSNSIAVGWDAHGAFGVACIGEKDSAVHLCRQVSPGVWIQ